MKSMEGHFGVIRDKKGIHAALQQSKSLNRQLAICFNSGGKLIVKISTVMRLVQGKEGRGVVLRLETAKPDTEFTILLKQIESVYPIRDFHDGKPETSREMDWTSEG